MIQVTIHDSGVHAALGRLLRLVQNPRPALKAIGELVMESTKETFGASKDPYGTPWAPNAASTLDAMLRSHSKNFTRKGAVSARGLRALGSKKPLIGESKSLSTQFAYRLVGGGVEVRSTMVYAAMQQFGGKRGQFPHLWGDIPARPFFPDEQRGLPSGWEHRILGVLSEAIGAAAGRPA